MVEADQDLTQIEDQAEDRHRGTVPAAPGTGKGADVDQSMLKVMARVEAFLYVSALFLSLWIFWSRGAGG